MTEKDSLNWDDAIENDGQEFIILPEGDYVFTVVDVERGWYNGSAKMSACNMAILTLEVRTPEGTARITNRLYLNRAVEWRISAFFRCIGQKQHGERLVMDWSRVPGAKGMAHFKPRTYTGQDGQERQANDVARWIDWDPAKMNAESGMRNAEFENDEDIPF